MDNLCGMPHIKSLKDFGDVKTMRLENLKLKFIKYEEIGTYIYLVITTPLDLHYYYPHILSHL